MKDVLIIDDDPAAGQLLVALVEKCGGRAQFAHSANDGIARVRTGYRPAAIILDLFMPEADGYETMRALVLAVPEGIPTILISANSIEHLEIARHFAQSIGWPVVAALAKPLTAAGLQVVLARLPELSA